MRLRLRGAPKLEVRERRILEDAATLLRQLGTVSSAPATLANTGAEAIEKTLAAMEAPNTSEPAPEAPTSDEGQDENDILAV